MKFNEVIYTDRSLFDIIKKEFPHATFIDARDEIHTDRFEVEIETEDKDIEKKFYIHAIKNNFALTCLSFQLMLCQDLEKIMEWIKEIKREINGGVEPSGAGPSLEN